MYNAVILAGGKTPWLQKAVGTNIRALAPLGGRRMVGILLMLWIKADRSAGS